MGALRIYKSIDRSAKTLRIPIYMARITVSIGEAQLPECGGFARRCCGYVVRICDQKGNRKDRSNLSVGMNC